ncbi:MAG: thioredoxin-disulfide reductase [Dehalococcoidia bacterium]|nr:thioredoxin-disulfide reductase [Dehalococcoidia bacterium]
MPGERIRLYGASWCVDCGRVKKLLGQNLLDFQWIDIEQDPEGMDFVQRTNEGKPVVPTLALPDGATMTQPTNLELAEKLGVSEAGEVPFFDLVVVGGGPAGLTAALYAAREGMETVVLEKSFPGGQAATTEWIENYPGFPEGVGGMDLSRRMEDQAKRFGVQIEFAEAQSLESRGRYRLVRTDSGDFAAWAVLIATGSSYRRLGAPGEERLIGRGVHYCATCDGPLYKGHELLVVGGGNSAAEEGFFLTKYASKVTLAVRRGDLSASQILKDKVLSSSKMDVMYHTQVKEFRGDRRLESVLLRNSQTGQEQEFKTDGAFIFIGLDPNTQWLKGALELDPYGFVVTSNTLQTSIPGVFAAGDGRASSTKQVASAAGEGVTAALMVRSYVRKD